jgi:glycerate kinase
VLVACDKFKGSLSAEQVRDLTVAAFDRAGLAAAGFLVADGGDGTLAAAASAGFRLIPALVHGPTGAPVTTQIARLGGRAVVELADACGLERLPGGRLAPLEASSRGLGEAIRAALAALAEGPRQLIVGVGGSASSDGGLGMVCGLGAALRGRDGRELPARLDLIGPETTLDLAALPPQLANADLVLASDVDAPLLGPGGAVAVFGPQKGLVGADARLREAELAAWADLVARTTGRDLRDAAGAGSAGGVGFGAMAVLGARPQSGIDLVLDMVGFRSALAGAGLVVTGEGRLDRQTLMGKTVAGVARAARAAHTGGVPVVAVCGISELAPADAAGLGLERVYQLADLERDPARSMAEAGSLLTTLCGRLADDWRGRLGEATT